MTKYPRTCEGDRWALVAKCVPNKTKEECLERYKHLVKMLKSQKAQEKQDDLAAEQQRAADQLAKAEAERQSVEMLAAESEQSETTAAQSGGGKRRNRRKEKKRNMDFSSNEDSE